MPEIIKPDEIQVHELPKVRIIENGKPVDTSAIDDYDPFMTFLMTASMAANIARMRKHDDDRISRGGIQNLTLNITQQSQEGLCDPICQSLYLENNGPGQIYVTINAQGKNPTPIIAGRAAYFPFETHVIECFYVWSATGTIATAIAILKY